MAAPMHNVFYLDDAVNVAGVIFIIMYYLLTLIYNHIYMLYLMNPALVHSTCLSRVVTVCCLL